MRIAQLLAVVLASICSLARAAPLTETLRTQVSAAVKVDAEGHVQSIGKLSPQMDERLAALLTERMRAIEFEPGRLNGVAVPVEANMTMTLGLREDGEGLHLELVSVGTGPAMSKIRKPQIPQDIMDRRENVLIVTRVEYDEAGKVVDAMVMHANVPIKRIEHLAVSTARAWEFSPEIVGGRPLAGVAIVPIRILVNADGPEAAQYTVAFNGGGKLKFRPELPKEHRETFVSALSARPESARGDIDVQAAKGS